MLDVSLAQPALLNLDSKADLAPAFPATCTGYLGSWEPQQRLCPILFPILFQITSPFPFLAFQPLLALLSLWPKGKPGFLTNKEKI